MIGGRLALLHGNAATLLLRGRATAMLLPDVARLRGHVAAVLLLRRDSARETRAAKVQV